MEATELIERCRRGDELAWEALVRNYQSRILSIAYTYVGNADEAGDLAQEVFVKIYRRLDSCRDPERFLAWMIRIARNVCLDHLRRQKARPPRQDIPVEELGSLADTGPGPDRRLLQEERKRLVFQALQSLSKINCEIILLKDMQGLPLDQIAEMLGVPVGTVKSRSNRARIELAKAVQALGGPSAAGVA